MDEIKPCRYCDDKPDILIVSDEAILTLEPDGYLRMRSYYYGAEVIKANYCPMCGRKL